MSRYLLFEQNGRKIKNIPVHPGAKNAYSLGSQKNTAQIYFDNSYISRDHAQVVVDEDGMVFVIDRSSTNGTYLNQKKMNPGIPYLIDQGDVVIFGRKDAGQLKLLSGSPEPRSQEKGTNGIDLLEQLKKKKKLIIGRAADCDVQISSELVSRRHTLLEMDLSGTIFINDLGSTNGTYVNGHRIQSKTEIRSRDTIVVGRSLIKFSEDSPKELNQELAISASRVLKQFKSGKIGLQKTDFEVATGSLVAIMGPSGCGKSTLLRCLTGESPATQGRVELKGLELRQNYQLLKTFIGYVPQDDIVHKQLTVYQSLRFAAKLRLDNPQEATIRKKIDSVLRQLKIDNIRDSPISRISGGQRKRVSIAVELLNDPMILFLDEPTSPLDPQTISEFMGILRDLAKKNKTTIVMVTHKPEDLTYMDSVLFLAAGGYPCYYGPVTEFKNHFNVSAAVEVYKMISGSESERWVDLYHQTKKPSQDPHSPHTPPRQHFKSRTNKSFGAQLYWLSARYMRIKRNDFLNILILLGQAPIIAGLVCLIFDKVSLPVPFVITLSAIWFGTSNAAREIVGEATIYRRERMFNLKIGPYILSKLLVLSLLGLLQALIFSIIIYLRFNSEGVDPKWNDFPMTLVWVWFLTINASVLGLMLSAIVNTTEKVMALVPIVLIPQVMLAGVVTPIKSFAVEIMSYFAPTRWGNEGLALIQQRMSSPDGLATVDSDSLLANRYHPHYGEEVFSALAYHVELDAIMLSLQTLILLSVLIIAMRRKDSIS